MHSSEKDRFRILVIDDVSEAHEALVEILAPRDVDVVRHLDVERGLALLIAEQDQIDLVLAGRDRRAPGGLGVLERAAQICPEIPRVVLAGPGDGAVSALRLGAFSFVSSPLDADAVALTVLRGCNLRRLQRRARKLEQRAAAEQRSPIALGTSPPTRPIAVPSASASEVEEYRTARRDVLESFDRAYFMRLLERTAGNLSEASRLSGIDRSNLRRALARMGLRGRRGDGPDADA